MRRTLVLGLDGATFRVLRPLLDDGHLPHIASLVETGASGTLTSSMPPVTGPAWLSLATGQSPGSTGVYDFIRRVPESEGYEFQYIDASTYEGVAVWDYLEDAGTRVGVVDYPTLSPPYDVSGFMVSGGLGTEETTTHPPDFGEELTAFDVAGHIDIGAEEYADLSTFADDIRTNLAARLDRLEYVLETQSWEFCWAVLQEPDWVQHLMWKCFDENHPDATAVTEAERELFVDFWRQVDDGVGRCRDLVGEDGNLVLVSDHGFGPMEDQSFRLNTWLKQEGYLVPKSGGSTHYWLKKRLWNTLSRVASAVDLQQRAPSLFRWGKTNFPRWRSNSTRLISITRPSSTRATSSRWGALRQRAGRRSGQADGSSRRSPGEVT
ncbi:alkaline phosphatase family protein [Haloarculaceae archaeon H-GB2-1]|nr:alkaline phosphatase family protein [Haloarculaceae archaeon H-GB11]MEA5406510.1 alkaline phosphatase family protein [Haloarculaceae archaeon H-GB2-1]